MSHSMRDLLENAVAIGDIASLSNIYDLKIKLLKN